MKVSVWDTWVTRKDGSMMHFDIIAPEEIKDASVIHEYGKAYLKTKGENGQPLTSKECRFCHVETVKPEWGNSIRSQGFYIIEMENCES
jgi:sorbitol-specific phosphotransferase system component IIA